MSKKWQNRILYWALAMVPASGLMVVGKVFGEIGFLLYLLFYMFLYRPLIDSQRLMSLKVIEEKDAWRFFVPFHRDSTRYFRQLWLG